MVVVSTAARVCVAPENTARITEPCRANALTPIFFLRFSDDPSTSAQSWRNGLVLRSLASSERREMRRTPNKTQPKNKIVDDENMSSVFTAFRKVSVLALRIAESRIPASP